MGNSFLAGGLFEHPIVRMGRLRERGIAAGPAIKEFVAACGKGDLKTVQRMIDAGVDLEAADPDTDGLDTPLWAAIYGRQAKVIELLAKAGANLDDGMSHPAEVAIDWGSVGLVGALLRGGLSADTIMQTGESLLRYAVMKKQPGVVKTLIEAGANVDLVPNHSRRMPSRLSPVQVAALDRHLELVEMLKAAGAKTDGVDALLFSAAAREGDVDAIRAAIARGMDVNATDAIGETPLLAALSCEGGAKIVGVVKLLIEAGANLKAKDPSGLTAIQLAKRGRARAVVKLLEEATSGGAKKAAKSKSAAVPKGTKLRGLLNTEVNDACVLVEAEVEAVAKLWKKRVKATVWKKKAVEEAVVVTKRCYAVMKLVGQPWATVARVACGPGEMPTPADAQFLSKSLKTRAIHVGISDTASVAQYAEYRNGVCARFYGQLSGTLEKTPAGVKSAFGVEIDGIAHVQFGKDSVIASEQKVTLTTKPGAKVVAAYLKAQNALAPLQDGCEGMDGVQLDGLFEDLLSEEIERLDFVAVSGR